MVPRKNRHVYISFSGSGGCGVHSPFSPLRKMTNGFSDNVLGEAEGN